MDDPDLPSLRCHRSMDHPVDKKRRLQGIWELGKTKVCFALLCLKRTRRGEIYESVYNVCVVDLLSYDVNDDCDDFTRSAPCFRINCDGSVGQLAVTDAFCALGNKLYVFEGCYDRSVDSARKGIYSFDISTPMIKSPQTLVKTELSKACDMTPKRSPAAIVAPCGQKILVFSIRSFESPGNASDTVGGFELFDTVDGGLLPVPLTGAEVAPYFILAYGFLDDTKLLVQVNYFQYSKMYVLDFQTLDKGWECTTKILCELERFPRSRFCYTSFFEIVQQQFCFQTCYGLHDLQVPEEEEELYLDFDKLFMMTDITSTIHANCGGSVEYLVTLLNDDEVKGECHFCELRLEKFEKQSLVRFQLDVCVADFKLYKHDLLHDIHKPRPDYTKGVKSLQFSLNLEGEYQVLNTRVFFSF